MKNTLLKNTFRSIGKTLGRFIAIFAIIALGSGFFSGIKAASPDMKKNAWNYFNEHSLDDIHIMSTFGFEDDELDTITSADEDFYCEGGYSADVFMESDLANRKAIKLYSYNSNAKLNKAEIIDGRLPEGDNECVIDYLMTDKPEIGEKAVFSVPENTELTLKETEYTVVGYVKLPMYISTERGTTSIGNGTLSGYVLVPYEKFDIDAYTDVYLKSDYAEKLNPFTDQYGAFIDEKMDLLENIGKDSIKNRVQKITDEAYEEIDKAKSELSEQITILLDSKKQLEEGQISYKNGHIAITQMRSVVAELNNVILEYNERAATNDEINLFIDNIDKDDVFAADETLVQLLTGYMSIPAAYDDGTKIACKNGLEQYILVLDEQIEAMSYELENAAKELQQAENEISEGEQKLDEAQLEIAEAENEIYENTKDAQWYVFCREDIYPAYGNYNDDCDKVDAIARVFPVFFILIAALVCWTTMTRMVEEQRTQTGTLKALGYGYGEIMGQYVLYAVLASIPGVVFGVTLGLKVLPKLIFICYNSMYAFDTFSAEFRWDYMVGCAVAACLCTGLSAFLACRIELSSKPAELMRPKPPKNGKRIWLEKITAIWSRMKFTTKVTFRNLFRYKSRFIMMIIGVGGCTALLLTGFALRHSIVSIVDRQYSNIFVYDAIAAIDEDKADYTEIEKYAFDFNSMFAMQKTDEIYSENSSAEVYLVVTDTDEDITPFFNIHNRKLGEHYSISDEGVIINEKLSLLLDVKIGDSVYFTENNPVKIIGIMENYTLNYAFIGSKLFDKLGLDYELKNNVMFLKSENNEMPDTEKLVSRDDILMVSYAKDGNESFGKLVDSLSFIVILIIVCAGALAFVVMFNLTNINVNERMHELATIKVLGFYDDEVAAYIYRENSISAFMGMLVGLIVGVFFEKFVIKTCEVDSVMFAPDIPLYCFLASAALTIAFALLVNLMLYFRLKKIDMAASLKSVE